MRKKFETKTEAEAEHTSLHPLLGAVILHRPAVAERVETSREADQDHDSIAALQAAIDRGDELAANALEFFQGTMWGREFASGARSFSSALECVDLDVGDYDYRPASTQAQAVKFVKRLWAAVKWVETSTVIPAVPEHWFVDVDSDIGLEPKYSAHCRRGEAEEDLKYKRAKGIIHDPLVRVIEHTDGFLKFRVVWLQKFSKKTRRENNLYDPSDSASGWGNAYGD